MNDKNTESIRQSYDRVADEYARRISGELQHQIPMLKDSSATTVKPGDATRARTDRLMSCPKSGKYVLDFSMIESLRTSSAITSLSAFRL